MNKKKDLQKNSKTKRKVAKGLNGLHYWKPQITKIHIKRCRARNIAQ